MVWSFSVRRLAAVICLATLVLAGSPALGALVPGGPDCPSMATSTPPSDQGGGHDCEPRPRIVVCAEAPCCALAPRGEEGRTLVPVPSSPLQHAPLLEIVDRAALCAPPIASPATDTPPDTRSGRERLALHAILLI